jgi:hypothetical protein
MGGWIMKTAEEWVTEYEATRHLPRKERKLIHSNGSYIKAVQLDAYLAGLRKADEVVRRVRQDLNIYPADEHLHIKLKIHTEITRAEKQGV